MNRIFLFCAFLFNVLILFSQGGTSSRFLFSESYVFDFGFIEQGERDVRADFTLLNISSDTIVIYDLIEECSCTEPKSDVDTIFSGGSVNINLGFMSSTNLGVFSKSVTVFTNKDTFDLKVKGVVTLNRDSAKTKLFNVSVGNLRFKQKTFALKTVYDQYPSKRLFEVFNNSIDTLFYVKTDGLPNNMTLVLSEPVPPNSTGFIEIKHEPISDGDYGFVIHDFTVFNDGSLDTFRVTKNLTPYINLDGEFYPSLEVIEGHQIDLGQIDRDRFYTIPLNVKNTGNKELKILQVKPSCDCVLVEPYLDNILSPGGMVTIQLKLSTMGRVGLMKKKVYIYSNDPYKPAYIYEIKARVNKE